MFAIRPYRKNDYITYNPFEELEALERSFFSDPFIDFFGNRTAAFGTDISDNGDSYLIEADLPGFNKKDIEISISGDTLTVLAKRNAENSEKDKDGKYLRIERRSGEYRRSFDLSSVDADNIKAKYENGVLSLTLPKKQPALPETRTLEIE